MLLGVVTKVVVTLFPMISRTRLLMSWSVILLMWPFLTFLFQICRGFEPIEYRMDRKPAWYLLANIFFWEFRMNRIECNVFEIN